jgi:hypothetical protein
MSPRTVDSWDFLTTMRSPLASVMGHSKGSSGGHGNGRSPTRSTFSRTSSTTSVSGRNQVASLTGQTSTAGILGGRVSEGETEKREDARDPKSSLLADGNEIKPDDALGQRGGDAGRKLEASALIDTSSTSSSPPSSAGCDDSSLPSSVSGAAPAPAIKSSEAGVGSTEVTPPSTRHLIKLPSGSDTDWGKKKAGVNIGTLMARKTKK